MSSTMGTQAKDAAFDALVTDSDIPVKRFDPLKDGAFIFAGSVAMNPATIGVGITTHDHSYEVELAQPFNERKQWLVIDRSTGFVMFALRRGVIFRDGVQVPDSFLGGIGISSDFKELILLDSDGRRFTRGTSRSGIIITEAWVDVVQFTE